MLQETLQAETVSLYEDGWFPTGWECTETLSPGHRFTDRFSQHCVPVYGTRVRAFEIMEPTPSTCCEQPASPDPLFGLNWLLWTQGGMHHTDSPPLDPHEWIAAVDGWRQAGRPIPEWWQRATC